MSRLRSPKPILLCAAAAALAVSAPRAAWCDATKSEADRALAAGRTAIEAGRVKDALKAWHEAWSKRPGSPALACNIGRGELLDGDDVAAYTWTERCVALSPRPSDPVEIEVQRKRNMDLAIARSRVALLAVEADSGADVLLDDVEVGVAPLPDHLVALPGKHELEARRGNRSIRTIVDAKAAREHQVALRFGGYTKVVNDVDPPPPEGIQPYFVEFSPRWTPILLGFGLTVATGVTSLGFGIAANNLRTDYTVLDLQRAAQNISCPSASNPSICQELSDTEARRSAFTTTSTVLGIASGALGVATIIFTVYETGHSKMTVKAVGLSAGYAGLQAGGLW